MILQDVSNAAAPVAGIDDILTKIMNGTIPPRSSLLLFQVIKATTSGFYFLHHLTIIILYKINVFVSKVKYVYEIH